MDVVSYIVKMSFLNLHRLPPHHSADAIPRRGWALALYEDLPCCPLWIPRVLDDHRGSCPFDRIFCPLASAACFRLLTVAVPLHKLIKKIVFSTKEASACKHLLRSSILEGNTLCQFDWWEIWVLNFNTHHHLIYCIHNVVHFLARYEAVVVYVVQSKRPLKRGSYNQCDKSNVYVVSLWRSNIRCSTPAS